MIGKVIGKSFSFHFLKTSLLKTFGDMGAWDLKLLGKGFFLLKFNSAMDAGRVLTEGPWSVAGYPLFLKAWEPGFKPSTAKVDTAVLWVTLPELPLELYDKDILRQIGGRLGKLIKIDVRTEAAERTRFARLCVQVDLNAKLPSVVWIGKIKQDIVVQDASKFCRFCKVYGHVISACNRCTKKEVVPPTAAKVTNGWRVVTRGGKKGAEISVPQTKEDHQTHSAPNKGKNKTLGSGITFSQSTNTNGDATPSQAITVTSEETNDSFETIFPSDFILKPQKSIRSSTLSHHSPHLSFFSKNPFQALQHATQIGEEETSGTDYTGEPQPLAIIVPNDSPQPLQITSISDIPPDNGSKGVSLSSCVYQSEAGHPGLEPEPTRSSDRFRRSAFGPRSGDSGLDGDKKDDTPTGLDSPKVARFEGNDDSRRAHSGPPPIQSRFGGIPESSQGALRLGDDEAGRDTLKAQNSSLPGTFNRPTGVAPQTERRIPTEPIHKRNRSVGPLGLCRDFHHNQMGSATGDSCTLGTRRSSRERKPNRFFSESFDDSSLRLGKEDSEVSVSREGKRRGGRGGGAAANAQA